MKRIAAAAATLVLGVTMCTTSAQAQDRERYTKALRPIASPSIDTANNVRNERRAPWQASRGNRDISRSQRERIYDRERDEGNQGQHADQQRRSIKTLSPRSKARRCTIVDAQSSSSRVRRMARSTAATGSSQSRARTSCSPVVCFMARPVPSGRELRRGSLTSRTPAMASTSVNAPATANFESARGFAKSASPPYGAKNR